MFKAAVDYRNPLSLGSRFRLKRARHIIELIDAIFAETGACRIIDVGGTELYWSILSDEYLKARNVTITLVNLKAVSVSNPLFTMLIADACDLASLDDLSFDLAHSNSVIEHVGLWPRVERFAAEFRRIAKRYYLQTPYFWFPWEPHFNCPFFHWLPEPVRVNLRMMCDLGGYPRSEDIADALRGIQAIHLFDRGMIRELFPDGEVKNEAFMGLTKSLIVMRRDPGA